MNLNVISSILYIMAYILAAVNFLISTQIDRSIERSILISSSGLSLLLLLLSPILLLINQNNLKDEQTHKIFKQKYNVYNGKEEED